MRLFKVSQFAHIAHVSVRLLHHYEQLGLLKPAQVDRESGYRYYALEQLADLNHILALKEMGLSLEEIQGLLREAVSPGQLQQLLLLKRAEIHERIATEQRRLALVESQLHTLTQTGQTGRYDVLIKTLEPVQTLALRQWMTPPMQVATVFRAAYEGLAAYHLLGYQAMMCVYYHAYWLSLGVRFNPPRSLVDAAYIYAVPPVENLVLTDGRAITKRVYPSHMVAYTLYHGPDHTRHEAFQYMYTWIKVHGYSLAAPAREIYLRRGRQPEDHLTEVQIPIVKADDLELHPTYDVPLEEKLL